MSRRRPQLTVREAVALAFVLTIGLTPLSAILGLEFLTPVIAITGIVILLPLIAILGDRLPYIGERTEEPAATTADVGAGTQAGTGVDPDDPVAKLRNRYARGEIDEAEFERRLERLLETEDLEGTVETDRDPMTELE